MSESTLAYPDNLGQYKVKFKCSAHEEFAISEVGVIFSYTSLKHVINATKV